MRLHCLFPFALLTGLATAQAKAGDPAPELVFETRINFGDLKAQKLSQLRGSAVLIEFWGTH